jgi:hypothetical protein
MSAKVRAFCRLDVVKPLYVLPVTHEWGFFLYLFQEMEIYGIKTMNYFHSDIQLNYNQGIYYTFCCKG